MPDVQWNRRGQWVWSREHKGERVRDGAKARGRAEEAGVGSLYNPLKDLGFCPDCLFLTL